MKTAIKIIKIIKPKRAEDSNNSVTAKAEKSVEQSTREMVSTVKSWITELQERKQAQRHSLSQLLSLPPSGEPGRPFVRGNGIEPSVAALGEKCHPHLFQHT